MSKTHKTRPLNVRIADRHDHGVEYVAVHNQHLHAVEGKCDLPATPRDAIKAGWTDCYYGDKFVGHGLHSCEMCTQGHARKAERRRDRHNIKRELRTHRDN